LDNFGTFSNDGKPIESKQTITEGSKASSKKGAQFGKSKKNQDIHFSSDEELEEIKNITLNDIDFNNPQSLTAKHLLETPEDLEDMDIKQYYHNPVRCCFDDPTLAFTPMCFL